MASAVTVDEKQAREEGGRGSESEKVSGRRRRRGGDSQASWTHRGGLAEMQSDAGRAVRRGEGVG
eukprot:5511526-Pleurochrysis_carterae.AAC.1